LIAARDPGALATIGPVILQEARSLERRILARELVAGDVTILVGEAERSPGLCVIGEDGALTHGSRPSPPLRQRPTGVARRLERADRHPDAKGRLTGVKARRRTQRHLASIEERTP